MSKATINIIGANDDLRTVIKKANDNFRALNKDIAINGINSGSSSTSVHNELTGRSEPNCHPTDAISGLTGTLKKIVAEIDKLNLSVEEIDKNVLALSKTVENHEGRIKALEDK